MISPAALQQSLLSLLCYDRTNSSIVARRVKAGSFLGRSNKLIATTVLEYIATFGKPPGEQIELLLEKDLRRGEDGKLLGQTLDILKEIFPSIQSEFIIKELETFEEIQLTTTAAQQALEELAQGNLEAAKEALTQIKQISKQKLSNGIWLRDSRGMLGFLDREDSDYLSTGVEALDMVGARPEKKTVSFMIAPTGKGKSWFLVNLIKAAIQYHNQAVAVTLELSAEKWAKRLIQAIFSLTSSEVKQIKVPYFDTSSGTPQIQFRDLQRDPVIRKKKEVSERLADFNTKVVIKEFDSGTLTVPGLENYLEYLEKEEGFLPDEVALDYAQLMKLDSANLRIEIGRLWVALRGLASRRDFALVSASQGNKESDTATTVDRGHVAEDWSQIGTADLVWTYSQTPQEKKLGLSRLLVAKARDTSDRIMILNSQAYAAGQFSIDSVVMNTEVMQEVTRVTNGTD